MDITYFDTEAVSDTGLTKAAASLTSYREHVRRVVQECDLTQPEVSLALYQDEAVRAEVQRITEQFKKVKQVILVGIGGQSLGVEAVHAALYQPGGPELHVLDTVAPHELEAVLQAVAKVKKPEQLAVVVSSKSGTTTEVLTNASTLLAALTKQFDKAIQQQVIYIGGEGNDLLQYGKRAKGTVVSFPEVVGGRYSVFSAAGLVPLALLGHDIDELLAGLEDASQDPYEPTVLESAARLYLYLKKKVRTVNVFVFDTRLVRFAKWYRQLAAESLGKETTSDGKPNPLGFVPTISTPVELHSTGQLFFSGFAGVYTDIVTLHDPVPDLTVPTHPLAGSLVKKKHSEILAATYQGVVGAYQERQLPYRATELSGDLPYALGLLMGMRMLETMYVAQLLDVNAFDQPNVELYKRITKEALQNDS